ncbi:hypothetical protein [Neisseria zalophi]|uniref:Uncharacterized protein n=1 Tax=Neisseria zalophi TaxID=640030 RepID=A0A5J6PU16_9NEIS|nr:hypothetical protein [Neisseria zalophi]QEY26191.1 hypothetical protein D0T92_06410 [Neisseria zalophi]
MKDKIILIKPKAWPKKFLNIEKDYIAITRPEDLDGFEYATSLRPNQSIDFNRLDLACTDITWEAWNYLLPLMERRYFENLPNEMEDFLISFFYYLSVSNNLQNLLDFLDTEDLKNFKDWILFILFSGDDPNSFVVEDELLSILEKL